MKEKTMDKLIGTYCKIVTKEHGEQHSHVVTGIVKDIEYEDGFIIIESYEGIGCLNIDTIVAIKPKEQKKI